MIFSRGEYGIKSIKIFISKEPNSSDGTANEENSSQEDILSSRMDNTSLGNEEVIDDINAVISAFYCVLYILFYLLSHVVYGVFFRKQNRLKIR